ncbi:MAG: aldehyde dehydrogenase family protein [Clostridiales Family XIII bacterium]|jgi:succinate-semialdehyde dehydrogenase|nr:aldehyde dehydrogenase family protein [Clostridiales Family XIII bacterium]
MTAQEQVNELITRARAAQKIFEGFSQEQVDRAVQAIGKAIYDNAKPLAEMAVAETKMGNVNDKIAKNMGKPKVTWYKLKGVPSRGVIRRIPEEGLVEVAKPIGVIGAITPVTNPIMTPIHNSMIALKGGNAIIVCPHPSAFESGKETVRIMREALKAVGAPEDLIQVVGEASIEVSGLIMSSCDSSIATGGPMMVKAVYSSGKPAFGVGAGNVQSLWDADADFDSAITKTITGRTYDNGVLCTCEQTIHVPEAKVEEVAAKFAAQGAYVITDPAEVSKLRDFVFPGGALNKDAVGIKPYLIAKGAGIEVPEDTRLLVVKVDKFGADETLCKEKLFPVLALAPYTTWENCVDHAATNINNEGTGHSCALHSNTPANVEYAAERISVSRFVVNQIGSNSLGGTLANGLNPTGTLGCGSWGNNSISENLWWKHLVNVSRIAYEIPDAPGLKLSDEELWAL